LRLRGAGDDGNDDAIFQPIDSNIADGFVFVEIYRQHFALNFFRGAIALRYEAAVNIIIGLGFDVVHGCR